MKTKIFGIALALSLASSFANASDRTCQIQVRKLVRSLESVLVKLEGKAPYDETNGFQVKLIKSEVIDPKSSSDTNRTYLVSVHHQDEGDTWLNNYKVVITDTESVVGPRLVRYSYLGIGSDD